MHTVLLALTSWLYKYNLRRSIVYKDGKTLFKHKAHRTVPPNASFTDGVATKDCSLDLTNRVSVRIFLPDHCLGTQVTSDNPKPFSWLPERSELFDGNSVVSAYAHNDELVDRARMDASPEYQKFENNEVRKAYYPNMKEKNKKLPVILQFHDGAFVNGSKDMEANDIFCRRIAKMCRSVVIAVGYRLAPEHKFPSARDDGIETLRWLTRQANLAEFSSSDAIHSSVGLVDSFSYMLADPWVTAHVDYSRCVLLGVGAGASIAEHVAREAASLSLELDPVKVVAQVLICPMFGGLALLPSEVLLADTYFLDRDTMLLLWKLVLPEGENRLDHPAVDPLLPSRIHSLRHMPSTLVISAELDMLRDRAAAYVDALKRWHVDATLLNYRNAVHQFVTLEPLVDAKLAQACLEDIAIWFGKHVKQEWC